MGEKSKGAAAAEKPKGEVEWIVKDSNAYPTPSNPTGEREHLTRDGTPYKLHHRKGVSMPMRHAVDFLCDEAFKVFDENAELVPHIKAQAASAAGAQLQPGQVIVTLAELSDQAILVRARRVNPLATKALGRDALIKLIEEGDDKAPEPGAENEDADGEAELASDE